VRVSNTQNNQSTKRKSTTPKYSQEASSEEDYPTHDLNYDQQIHETSMIKTAEDIERERQLQIEDDFHQTISNYV
jgi:hypothetical protein